MSTRTPDATRPGGYRTGHRSRRRRRAAAIGAAAALTATALGAVPASGLVGPAGVRAGKSITVVHNLDLVAVSGYEPLGRRLAVRVVRNGVTVGSVVGRSVSTPTGTGLEINHGAEDGAPQAGECWDGHTPDIRPGDLVVVSDGTGRDEVVVDDIRFTGEPQDDGGTGDVTVPFRAVDAGGVPIPVERLDSAAFRDDSVRFDADQILVEAAAGGAPGDYVLRYPSPFQPRPDDEDEPLSQAQIRAALLQGDEHSIGFGDLAGLPEAMLHEGLRDLPGPAAGCEVAAPLVPHGVTSVSPRIVNAATAPDAEVVVEGFSDAASGVQVRLSHADGSAPVVADAVITAAEAAGDSQQTWRAVFAAQDLDGLQGLLQAVAVVDGTEASLTRTFLRDTVLPAVPRVSLPAGTYRGAQRVSLTAAPSDRIRYTVGDGSQAAPTARSGIRYRGGALLIDSTQTLKLVAVDEARNVSPVVRQRYRILTAPSAPAIGRATPGERGGVRTAVASWAPPASNNGARVSGYRVVALRLGPTGAVVGRKWSDMVRPRARSLEMRLRQGRYRFQVRAVNGLGASALSAVSNVVRSR